MVKLFQLAVMLTLFAYIQSHPGGKKLHAHAKKPNAIVKLRTSIHSVEALISKQEEKLTKGFQSLTKRVSNMKVLAKKAEKALEKRKMNCSIPLSPPNGHVLGLEHDANGVVRLPSNGVVYFVCNDGYHLVGSEQRICLHGGKWSGNDSVCKDISSQLLSCAKLDCLNGGICTKSRNGTKYQCVCSAGYHGKRCQKERRLAADDRSVMRAHCTSDKGKEMCSCPIGYIVDVDLDQKICVDTDECLRRDTFETEILVIPEDIIGSMTKRHAYKPTCRYECQNTFGSYQCLCPSGYISDPTLECRDIDECAEATHNCTEEQRCFNTGGGYQCLQVTCPENYFAESFFVCRRRPCPATDRHCRKQALTYTYNFIQLPATLIYPSGVFRASAEGSSRSNRFTILRGPHSENFKSRRLDDQSAMVTLLRPLNRNQHITVDFEMKELEANIGRKFQTNHVYRITFFQSFYDF